METGKQIQKYILSTLLIILVLLAGFIAIQAYRYYGVVVRDILGVFMIYLMLYYVRFPGNEVLSLDDLISVPNKTKFFILAIILTILSCWAYLQIAEMVLFYKQGRV
jgi:hypothetical protein